jgi:hypothetical protein
VAAASGTMATRPSTAGRGRAGEREGGGDQPADGPGAVEGRQDRPGVLVLEGDGLHVDGGVDHAERHAVAGDGHREHGHVRRQVATGTVTAVPSRAARSGSADPNLGASRSATRCRRRPAGPAEQQQRQLDLGQRPAVRERRQPGGQADEHEPWVRNAPATASRLRRETGSHRADASVAGGRGEDARAKCCAVRRRAPRCLVATTGHSCGAGRRPRSPGSRSSAHQAATRRSTRFGDRLRYWFDNSMSRGTPALIAWLTRGHGAADPACSR